MRIRYADVWQHGSRKMHRKVSAGAEARVRLVRQEGSDGANGRCAPRTVHTRHAEKNYEKQGGGAAWFKARASIKHFLPKAPWLPHTGLEKGGNGLKRMRMNKCSQEGGA